jgi:hypothetical protein
MPRPTLSQIVSRIVDETGLRPSSVEDGDAVFSDGAIRHTLTFHRSGPLLSWTVKAEGERYREPMAEFGGVGFEIWRPARPRPPGEQAGEYRYPVPASLDTIDPALFEDVRTYGPQTVAFVADEADLGRLLLAPRDVHRGDVWANLPEGSAPGRLVDAAIVARATGDRELEAAIADLLGREGERDISWAPGEPYLFRESVADWAKKLAPAVDVDLTDLIALRKPRRKKRPA